MKTTKILLSFAAVILIAGFVGAQNTLLVPDTGECAMNSSNFGLKTIKVNGATDSTFVQDNTPGNGTVGESVYRAEFWIDPTNLVMGHRQKIIIHSTLQEGAGYRPYQLLLGYNITNGYSVWPYLVKNNGVKVPTPGKVFISGPTRIMVEWQQAQGGGIDDGYIIISAPDLGTSSTLSGQRNSLLSVGRIRMGLCGHLYANQSGHLCFDEFASYRTMSTPPPAP